MDATADNRDVPSAAWIDLSQRFLREVEEDEKFVYQHDVDED